MREMKDSGVAWIGEIPKEWEISLVNTLYTVRNTKVSDVDYQPLSVTMKGIVPQLSTAAKTNAHDDRKLVKKGDFAINSRSDRRGSCGISDYDGSVSLINTVLSPRNEMNPIYYSWLFHSSEFADEFYRWGHGIVDDLWTTRWQEMRNISIPVPPLSIQHQIATYLDQKCTQIGALITNQQKQIEKLKAYKQSLITETVTKGLNPDVPMKDSGVEWIGEIPEGWDILQLSSVVTERKHKNIGMIETNLLSLSYGNVIRKNINTTDGLLPESFEGYNIIEAGDIVLRLTDLQNDHKSLRSGLCTERGIITSAYVTLANRGGTLISEYLHYLLHTFDIYKGFYGMGAGVRQGLNFDGIKKILLTRPKIEEQQAIVSYLDQKCTQIDSLIAIKQRKIEKLQQYKKSVIYEYVTGKKEVK